MISVFRTRPASGGSSDEECPLDNWINRRVNMSREEIKDRDGYTILGYIETTPDGKQKAIAKDGYTTLGLYVSARNETFGANGYTVIAHGNVLSALIYQRR
jgi:hypothetical protein